MAYTLRLLMMFVLASLLPVQGHDACYDTSDEWSYHSHTHSCFDVVRISKTWEEARDYCRREGLPGSEFQAKKHLAKIGDSNTNIFVKGILPGVSWMGWIGLHYESSREAFRWDGYVDEQLVFTDPLWNEDPSNPVVAIRKDGWHGKAETKTYHLVCQHQAKTIGPVSCDQQVQSNALRYTCTSAKSPSKGTCRWTYRYNGDANRDWKDINNPTYTDVGSGFTTACSFTLFDMRLGKVNFQLEMYPIITGMDLIGNAKASRVWLQVYNIAQPSEAKFTVSNKEVKGSTAFVVQGSNDVSISCNIDTGNPPVTSTMMSCESPIANGVTTQSGTSSSVQLGQATETVDGKKCTCWGNHVTGTTQDFVVTLKVFSKANELLCQSDLRPDGLLLTCRIDKIFPQALCRFWYRNEEEATFSPLSSKATIDYSQKPFRDSENLPYYQSNCIVNLTRDVMVFTPGSLTLRTTVNPNIDGIDEDTLSEAFVTTNDIVNIGLPNNPQFKKSNMTLDSSSPVYFIEKDNIELLCEIASGTPTVHSVTLSCDFSFTGSDDDNKHTVPGTTYVISETASRDMNGSSCTCIGNHLTGPLESSPLTFKITTLLAHCDGEESVDHEVKLDQNAVLTICLAAVPSPPSLEMQFDSESGWSVITNPTATITTGVNPDNLTIVTVTFSEVKATDLGDYRLYDPDVLESARSYLEFSLSKPQSGSSSGNAGAIAGAVVSVIIVIIIIIIIVVIYIRWRRRKREEDGEGVRVKNGQDDFTPVGVWTRKKSDTNANRNYSSDDYAKVNVSFKKKADVNGTEKTDNATGVYSNEGFRDKDDGNEKETEGAYSNLTVKNTPPTANKTSELKTATPSDDHELVYIEVDVAGKANKQTKASKKQKPQNKATKEDEDHPQAEATEYAGISADATISIKMEIEKKEEKKKQEKKNRKDGNEEDVYENT